VSSALSTTRSELAVLKNYGRLADWPLRSEAEEKDKGRAFMKVNVAEITRRWMDRGYFLKDRRTLSVQKTAT